MTEKKTNYMYKYIVEYNIPKIISIVCMFIFTIYKCL